MKLAEVFAVGCKELNQNMNNQFAAVRWERSNANAPNTWPLTFRVRYFYVAAL